MISWKFKNKDTDSMTYSPTPSLAQSPIHYNKMPQSSQGK